MKLSSELVAGFKFVAYGEDLRVGGRLDCYRHVRAHRGTRLSVGLPPSYSRFEGSYIVTQIRRCCVAGGVGPSRFLEVWARLPGDKLVYHFLVLEDASCALS